MIQIRKLLRYLRPYWQLSVLALVMLSSLVVLDLAIPRLIQRIIDQGIARQDMGVVLNTSMLMVGISLLSMVIAVGNNIFSVRVGESVARDLREAIFQKIMTFTHGNLDRFPTGKLMVRLTSDAGAVQRVFQISLRIGTRAPLLMVGSLILMINTDSRLALTLLPLLLVTTGVVVFFSAKLEPLFRSMQQKLDRLNSVLQENIAGARLVKAFVRMDYEAGRFEEVNEEFTGRTVVVMRWMAVMTPLLQVLVNLGVVGIIYYGGLRAVEGDISLGQIVAFVNYLLTTMTPLTMMTNLTNVWAQGIASAQRINEVLDMVPEVSDTAAAVTLPEKIVGRVVFEKVGFHYNGSSDESVLEGINLVAEPGKTLAILGATGAGKTSLVNLIPRFYDVSAGRITVDGVEIKDIRRDSLLAQVAIVPQESILFSGSVSENIRYGRFQATDDEVMAAAKAAQAHEFILQLPQGYDTHIEERGVNLSGGQKQRIAIARALVAKSQILILDDSTSSVDVETENKIHQGLDENIGGQTRFMVAQRVSTVLNADKIVVIDDGHLAASGTHAELLASSPIYQEIYATQLGNGLHVEKNSNGD